MTNKEAIDLMEYALILGRAAGYGAPEVSPSAYAVANTVAKLSRLGVEAHSWAERMCNYGERVEGEDTRKRASIATRAGAALSTLGLMQGSEVDVGGDPRGSCLKIRIPGLSELRF